MQWDLWGTQCVDLYTVGETHYLELQLQCNVASNVSNHFPALFYDWKPWALICLSQVVREMDILSFTRACHSGTMAKLS